MNEKQAERVIRKEIACVKSAETCGRNCRICPLVMDEDEILNAYELSISCMQKICIAREILRWLCGVACALSFLAGMFFASSIDSGSQISLVGVLVCWFASVIFGNIWLDGEDE